MLPGEFKELQPCKEPPCITKVPPELVAMIIREYAIGSVTKERSIPMNFLLICQRWTAVARDCQHLFTPQHLVVNGHDEVAQLETLYKGKLIPPTITNLTVNLAPKYEEKPLDGCLATAPGLQQIQQTVSRLREMLLLDWLPANDRDPGRWNSLTLERFSIVVDLSAVSDRKPLFRGWTWSWVSRLGKQWGAMGWTGSTGRYGENIYTYWDR